MISVFCLPFDDLTKHALSAKLPITQGRREWGNALSLPSLVSSSNDPEYGVYASTYYRTLTITKGTMDLLDTWIHRS